jgi:hypothetical protein
MPMMDLGVGTGSFQKKYKRPYDHKKDASKFKITPRPGSRGPAISGGGGYFGGGADAGQYGQQDIDAQNKLAEEAWRKTTPDLNYIGGSNKWTQNPDGTWALTAELDDDYTKIREDAIRRQGMFGQAAEDLASGGWRDAQKSRYGDMMGIYEEELAVADQLRRAREVNTGASSTTRFMNQRDADATTNRLKLGAMNQAFQESQQLIDSDLARSQGQYNMLTGIGDRSNALLANQMSYANPTANLDRQSLAETRLRDQLAGADMEKRKGKNKFWNSIFSLGGKALGVPDAISKPVGSFLFG